MGIHFVTVFTVIGEALPTFRSAICVAGYKFRDAWKSFGETRNFIAQVYQQVSRWHCVRFTANGYCRRDIVGGEIVRNEAAVAKRPQELIEALGIGPILGMDIDGIVETIGLFRQPAGQHVAGLFVDPVENVKVDSCHEVLGQCAGACQQHFAKHRDRSSGGAFLRAGFPGDTRNVQMRPIHAVSESAQETASSD